MTIEEEEHEGELPPMHTRMHVHARVEEGERERRIKEKRGEAHERE